MIHMLEYLKRFVDRHSGYRLSGYSLFVDNILMYLNKHVKRTELSVGYENPGVSKLRHVLNMVDYSWMGSRSLTDIYLNYLRHDKDSMDSVYSQVMTGQHFTGMFINNKDTSEYLIPVDDFNTIHRLPMDDSWIYWKFMYPLRLHWVDTLELSFNVINSRVQYSRFPPSYAVFTLDPIMLVLKYIMWCREGKQDEFRPEDTLTQQLYIHKYVIAPLLYDLTDSWLLQCVNMTMHNQFSPGRETTSTQFLKAIDDTQYTYFGVRFSDGFRTLANEVTDIIKNVHPRVLANSPLFLNKRSIYQKIYQYQELSPIAQLGHYEYLRIMRDIDLYKLTLDLYALNPDLPVSKSMMIEQRRQWKRIANRKPWQKCRNVNVAKIIEAKFFKMVNDVYM